MLEKSSTTKDSKPKAKQNIEGAVKPMLSKARDGGFSTFLPSLPSFLPYFLPMLCTYIHMSVCKEPGQQWRQVKAKSWAKARGGRWEVRGQHKRPLKRRTCRMPLCVWVDIFNSTESSDGDVHSTKSKFNDQVK